MVEGSCVPQNKARSAQLGAGVQSAQLAASRLPAAKLRSRSWPPTFFYSQAADQPGHYTKTVGLRMAGQLHLDAYCTNKGGSWPVTGPKSHPVGKTTPCSPCPNALSEYTGWHVAQPCSLHSHYCAGAASPYTHTKN